MQATTARLSWALVIATYRREEILPRCIELAVAQTRRPREIIVVDSSPNWAETRDRVLGTIAPRHADIRWDYVQGSRPSSAVQRNEGVRLATADVVFLIDDDSLMYPDCAEHIMQLYEADTERRVAGVNAVHVPVPPDQPPGEAAPKLTENSTTRRYSPLARWVRKVLRADDIFVPYDTDFPRHEVPSALSAFRIGTRPLMAGWGMTFRREIALSEPFNEVMSYYASGEDSDMGYRASRHGALLTALDAKLCHVGSSGGRLPVFVVTALGGLNPLVLHRLYSTDLERSRRRSRDLLARRACIAFTKDLAQRQFSLPRARGTLYARGLVDRVFAKSHDELRAWYPDFQRTLIEGARKR